MGRWMLFVPPRLVLLVLAVTCWLAVPRAGAGDDVPALPPLVSIRDVLADVNAPARRLVTVRGVVTWRGANGLIMQDDSGGIWIDTPAQPERRGFPQIDSSVLARLTPGLEVEVHGWANRGGYSPNISPVGIHILGERSAPEPRPVDRDRFFSGAGLRMGEQIVMPRGTPLCNAWLTILKGSGIDMPSFGDSTGVVESLVG